MADSDNGDSSILKDLGSSQIVAIATAATTLIAAISGLAVTGALQQMQRDHGVYLVVALGLVLAAAVLWAMLTLINPSSKDKPSSTENPTSGTNPSDSSADPPTTALAITTGDPPSTIMTVLSRSEPAGTQAHVKDDTQDQSARTVLVRRVLQGIALVGFAAGIVVGLWGMVETQKERVRPSVVASYDATKSTLTVTATAHNLGSDGRMLTELRPMQVEMAKDGSLVTLQRLGMPVRWAYTGPDSNGTALQKFTWKNDRNYGAVEVSATVGPEAKPCIEEGEWKIPQHSMSGCVVLVLPKPTG